MRISEKRPSRRKLPLTLKLDPDNIAWLRRQATRGQAILPGVSARITTGTAANALIRWARRQEKSRRLSARKLFLADGR